MPLIMSNEDVRLKVIKVYDEIVQSLKRQLDEATRMREEIRSEKKGKIIEEEGEEGAEEKESRKRRTRKK
jgi:hypothetical protein